MYIQIGDDFTVRDQTLVGVFDLDHTSASLKTRRFLHAAQEQGELVETTQELPKSFLLTAEYGLQRVYLTKYNAAVLEKRFRDAGAARRAADTKEHDR